MSTDLELLKQFINSNSENYGDLDGIFIPFLRAYFLLTKSRFEVHDVIYKQTLDDHYDCAYVSFSSGDKITVLHHEGTYRVFDNIITSPCAPEVWRCGVGENGCFLESDYADGVYYSLVKIEMWVIYKGIRGDLGLEDYDNFDRIFKGFVAFKEYLAAL